VWEVFCYSRHVALALTPQNRVSMAGQKKIKDKKEKKRDYYFKGLSSEDCQDYLISQLTR
jgi:hypothetical protein